MAVTSQDLWWPPLQPLCAELRDLDGASHLDQLKGNAKYLSEGLGLFKRPSAASKARLQAGEPLPFPGQEQGKPQPDLVPAALQLSQYLVGWARSNLWVWDFWGCLVWALPAREGAADVARQCRARARGGLSIPPADSRFAARPRYLSCATMARRTWTSCRPTCSCSGSPRPPGSAPLAPI